jgi:hypothetical protein
MTEAIIILGLLIGVLWGIESIRSEPQTHIKHDTRTPQQIAEDEERLWRGFPEG